MTGLVVLLAACGLGIAAGLRGANRRRRRTVAVRVAVGLAGFAVLVACVVWYASQPPGGMAAANATLRRLERDPVLNRMPPGARRYIATIPPVPRDTGNYGPVTENDGPLTVTTPWWDDIDHEWEGLQVTACFYSALPYRQVFAFYTKLSAATGWHVSATSANGLIAGWRKAYPSGYAAGVGLDGGTMARVPTLNAPGSQPYCLWAWASNAT